MLWHLSPLLSFSMSKSHFTKQICTLSKDYYHFTSQNSVIIVLLHVYDLQNCELWYGSLLVPEKEFNLNSTLINNYLFLFFRVKTALKELHHMYHYQPQKTNKQTNVSDCKQSKMTSYSFISMVQPEVKFLDGHCFNKMISVDDKELLPFGFLYAF